MQPRLERMLIGADTAPWIKQIACVHCNARNPWVVVAMLEENEHANLIGEVPVEGTVVVCVNCEGWTTIDEIGEPRHMTEDDIREHPELMAQLIDLRVIEVVREALEELVRNGQLKRPRRR